MIIYIAQLNSIQFNLQRNLEQIITVYRKASDMSVDLVVFPAYFLSGYFIDLPLTEYNLFAQYQDALSKIAAYTTNSKTQILLSAITEKTGTLYHSYFLLASGKTDLLGEISFDKRLIVKILPYKIETEIYHKGKSIEQDGNILIFFSASPYHLEWEISNIKLENNLVYINPVGGYGSHVFSGGSFVINKFAQKIKLQKFKEDELLVNMSQQIKNQTTIRHDSTEVEMYSALVLSLRDYVHKNGFETVLLGLSGGVDSALVATIAADALGSDKVFGYMLPSRYTSQTSLSDAENIANKLGISYNIINIESVFITLLEVLTAPFADYPEDVTEENIQSRIRGLILMAISNKCSRMLLATGNKSEFLSGYATIYGDMCGGFAPIADVYKTNVYKLCLWRNRNIPDGGLVNKLNIIPESVIQKPPTAELRFNQKDQDSLPDYEILDLILHLITTERKDAMQIAALGYRLDLVEQIFELVRKSEFKRSQAPLGTMVASP